MELSLIQRQSGQDQGKVISNYANICLSDAKKSLLVKSLFFSFHQRNLIMHIIYLFFELFYRSIYNLDIM